MFNLLMQHFRSIPVVDVLIVSWTPEKPEAADLLFMMS